MRIFLTGATGFIGSAVASELLQSGHQVIGMARSDESARVLQALGAEVHRGTLEDVASVQSGTETADAVIHTAFDHDFSRFVENCDKDRRVIGALGQALKGSNRPLLLTSVTGVGATAHGQLAREDDELRKFHGLARSLVANAVAGVTDGFKKELDIVGVGYRAELKGKQVHFALGYSHPVIFDIPNGIDIAVDKQTHSVVTGVDRQLVGQVAANIRRMRKPDPYKQKGVRYTGEVLKKKVGKTGAK